MAVRFNEDPEMVQTIKEGLKRTGGYCPCRLERTEDNKCICKEFRRQIADPNFKGYCHCLLYYKDWFFWKKEKNLLTNDALRGNISKRSGNPDRSYARVVELVDSLDSGSSAHSGRGGSSPPSRTKLARWFWYETIVLFLCLKSILAQGFSMFWRSILVSLYQNLLHESWSWRT